MIYKDINYANVPNVTVAEFGNGTISICSSKGEGYEGILMKSHEQKTIGETGIKYKDSNEFKPELSIVFRNRESFDVFYNAVLEVKNEFEKQTDRIAYTLNFGDAIKALKEGKLIARKGWNGKGMFVFMRPSDKLSVEVIVNNVKSLPESIKNHFKSKFSWTQQEAIDGYGPDKELIEFTPYLCMKAADGSIINGWLASQTDMLAEDWEIIQ
jgi:hypothetical protein